jgi:hypothetical protein
MTTVESDGSFRAVQSALRPPGLSRLTKHEIHVHQMTRVFQVRCACLLAFQDGVIRLDESRHHDLNRELGFDDPATFAAHFFGALWLS